MQALAPDPLASAVLNAPAWQRLGITVPDRRLREKAARALAVSIINQLDRDQPPYDPRQLSLSL
ncbi:DUF6771 family protein [Sphingomonas floccifaciens]|uniref:DUF6771 family protein n=1 Tax=Sphingomonas floccifaciens TaxID=1844115 RepID=A0ABW4N8Y9_9SPHN